MRTEKIVRSKVEAEREIREEEFETNETTRRKEGKGKAKKRGTRRCSSTDVDGKEGIV